MKRENYSSFSDEELISMTRQAYHNARNSGKEGAGTHRNAGDCGRISQEWVTLHMVCKQRGIDYQMETVK